MPQSIDVFLGARAQEAGTSPSFVMGFRNAHGDDPAEILIDGVIGDRYEANDSRSMGEFLRANKSKPVKVWINSGGGLAFDGISMHNALVAHDAPVTTVISGIAGSAASIIAMAGSKVQMYENAILYIHQAKILAYVNEDGVDEVRSWLSKLNDAIARTYRAKNGMALEKIKSLMSGKGKGDGSEFSAKESLAGKWVDEVLAVARRPADGKKVSALLQSAFNASLGDAKFKSACSCLGAKQQVEIKAYGCRLSRMDLHSEVCPVIAEYQSECATFCARHAKLDEEEAGALKRRIDRGAVLRKSEAASLERVRSRRDCGFTPAE
jgi:ATP-dependent protease ClpP protease subunit